jgi:hypothetical protein
MVKADPGLARGFLQPKDNSTMLTDWNANDISLVRQLVHKAEDARRKLLFLDRLPLCVPAAAPN